VLKAREVGAYAPTSFSGKIVGYRIT